MSLWLSLNEMEKRVLLDMVEDGLVNPENVHTVEILCNKGLIKTENGMLAMMNLSFRHFVSSLQTEITLKKWGEISTETGTWSRLRTPIIVVLILVAAFIFITQKEAFNSMLAYFTAFSGGILGIMKLVSYLPSANKSSGQ